MDGDYFARCSRLSAKFDNTAIQDGFRIYLHNFIVSDEGQWTVVQQGMNNKTSTPRRYHCHSPSLLSFVKESRTSIYGQNTGIILSMVDKQSASARLSVMEISRESPVKMLAEIRKITMPSRHDVRAKDVDLKRLGSI